MIDFLYVNSTILAKWMAEVILSKITFILIIWLASFEVKDALKGVLLLPLPSALTLILLPLYSFQFISFVFLYYFLKIIYFFCFATEVSFWQVAFWSVLTEDIAWFSQLTSPPSLKKFHELNVPSNKEECQGRGGCVFRPIIRLLFHADPQMFQDRICQGCWNCCSHTRSISWGLQTKVQFIIHILKNLPGKQDWPH